MMIDTSTGTVYTAADCLCWTYRMTPREGVRTTHHGVTTVTASVSNIRIHHCPEISRIPTSNSFDCKIIKFGKSWEAGRGNSGKVVASLLDGVRIHLSAWIHDSIKRI